MSNKVFCYYQSLSKKDQKTKGRPGFSWFSKDSSQLLDIWAESWESQGWDPVFLDLKDAQRHYAWDDLLIDDESPILNACSSLHPKMYMKAAFSRWFAYANAANENKNGFIVWADYDVINWGLRPEDLNIHDGYNNQVEKQNISTSGTKKFCRRWQPEGSSGVMTKELGDIHTQSINFVFNNMEGELPFAIKNRQGKDATKQVVERLKKTVEIGKSSDMHVLFQNLASCSSPYSREGKGLTHFHGGWPGTPMGKKVREEYMSKLPPPKIKGQRRSRLNWVKCFLYNEHSEKEFVKKLYELEDKENFPFVKK